MLTSLADVYMREPKHIAESSRRLEHVQPCVAISTQRACSASAEAGAVACSIRVGTHNQMHMYGVDPAAAGFEAPELNVVLAHILKPHAEMLISMLREVAAEQHKEQCSWWEMCADGANVPMCSAEFTC
jgi:hypothetical protein